MRKAKLSLMASVTMGLFAITTAGVSTYAWFQANANVTINAESTSTTITVSAPDDILIGTPHLYQYNGNFYSSDEENITFTEGDDPDEFTEIEAEDEVSTTDMYPGQKATYCIVVGSSGRKISGGSLTLGSDTSYSIAKPEDSPESKHFYVYTGGSESSPTTPVNKDSVLFRDAIFLKGGVTTSASTEYNDDVTTDSDYSPTNGMELCSISFVDVETLYFYFTVLFSDDPTTYYQEYVTSPSIKPTYEKRPNSGDRYFYKTENGNSNCYEGWTFTLTKLTVSIY